MDLNGNELFTSFLLRLSQEALEVFFSEYLVEPSLEVDLPDRRKDSPKASVLGICVYCQVESEEHEFTSGCVDHPRDLDCIPRDESPRREAVQSLLHRQRIAEEEFLVDDTTSSDCTLALHHDDEDACEVVSIPLLATWLFPMMLLGEDIIAELIEAPGQLLVVWGDRVDLYYLHSFENEEKCEYPGDTCKKRNEKLHYRPPIC